MLRLSESKEEQVLHLPSVSNFAGMPANYCSSRSSHALAGGVSPAWADAKSLPYSYGFENNDLAAEGWTKGAQNHSSTGINTEAKQNGSYGFKFYYQNNSTGLQYLISPELSTTTVPVIVNFYYKNNSTSYTETFHVGYSTGNTDIESFTFGDEISISSGAWTLYNNSFPAGTKYIAIKFTSDDKYFLYVDDFSAATAVQPTALTVSDITSSSVKLNWTSSESKWDIQYKKTSDADWTLKEGVTSNSDYVLSGLSSATNYQVRVRANDGNGKMSAWTATEAFTTDCATVTIDASHSLSEDFSGGTTIPICWGKIDNSSYKWTISSDGYAYSGYYGPIYLILPPMTLSVASWLTFDNYFNYVSSYNGTSAKSSIVLSTTGTAADNFTTTLFTFTKDELPSSSSTSLPKEISLAAYTGQTVYIAFKYEGNNAHAWYVDNVVVEKAPACMKPTGLIATNPTNEGATLSWTAGSDETEWKVIYGAAGFDPASAGTTIDNVTTNPYTLTGLTAETEYDVYVKAVKGSDVSEVSNKANFTTLSAAPVIELSATSLSFGIVKDAEAQTQTFTIGNTGGAALANFSVTSDNAAFTITDGEGNALPTSLAASTTLTVKVKMNTLGQQNGTITVKGDGMEDKTVTVSGYMLDDTKIAETFASKPDRWTASGSWTYNATTGAYGTSSSTTLTSPKIIVGDGEKLTISAKQAYSGSYYLKVEGYNTSTNAWETIKQLSTASDPALSTTDFTIVTLDVATTVNRLRITSYYSYINALNGFTYDEDPQLALYSDEACTTTQAATATKNYGFVTEAQQQKYYIKNTGNGQIDLTIEQADGFTAAVDDAALTEGEKAVLTIDMDATEGLHNGTVTVTTKNHKTYEVLGTFAVTLNAGVAGSKNDINFVADALSELPAGWESTTWTVTNSQYVGIGYNSGATGDLTSQTYTVGAGETLLFEAKATQYQTGSLSYSYKAGSADWTTATTVSGLSNTEWKVFAISGISAGDAKVKFTGQYVQIRRIYGFEPASVPVMVFSAADKNFGMVTAATTSDAYTITNSGAGVLNGLSVTCDDDNFEIAVAEDATSIAANGGTATFTVKLKNTTKGLHEGTVTIAGTGVESKTFAVKGYVADDKKIYETFASLPSRWVEYNYSSYYSDYNWSYSATNGAYNTNVNSTLTSPKITVAGDLVLSVKLGTGSGSVTVEGSSNNGSDWEAFTGTYNSSSNSLNTSDFTIVTISDIPTTVNKLRIKSYYAYINGLNGFTYDQNDPEFSIYSDDTYADNKKITAASATNAWGFLSKDESATYYIKNTGTGTMTLSKTEAPDGFTATLGTTSLGASESTTLVIAMANNADNNEGYHSGNVVLTAKDNADNTLGTFTVTSSGVVVGSKTDINFATLDAFPAGWETTTWTVTANDKATVGYSTGTLTTGTYSVAAGEKMVVLAKKNGSSGTLSYKVSTDGGASWSDATTITPSSTTDYELKVIEGISASDNVKIEFTGYCADIQRIYGFTAVAKPVMTLSPAATSYDFGMKTAADTYEITVTNSGTATMENLAVALETGIDYTAVITKPAGESTTTVTDGKATVPVGQSAVITVTQLYDASKGLTSLSDKLTISADGLADKVITLSGKTRDASKLFVDFDNVSLPDTWDNEGWTVYNYGSDDYLYNSSNTTAYAVTTQALTVAEGESISFDVKAYSSYGSPYLTVRYSYNGGIDWTDFATYAYSDESLTTSFVKKTINGLNAGKVVLQFVGTYCGIDNIIGFAPKADEPTISVKKSSTTVNNGATEAFGSIKNEATATYTIKNIGQGTLTITSPVTITGEATATVSATSLANGESATLTITMPIAAPYEYKEGAVTVKTSLGDFVINYNATILNPNALDEQFASGKPAGWYFGGYWEVSSQRAENTASGVADLITEQLAVEGTSDILTFQAARTSSSSAPTFKVYTSQDRVTWNEVDLSSLALTTSYQDVTISGLAKGDYYVKISGARVKVDNFLGWTKKNNAHDLYVTATSFPATTTKGNDATITATVTSLIAAETGVYAKLFIDGVQEGDATAAQDIALNGTKTFSFTYAIPQNKTAQVKVYYSDDTEAFATAENAMKVNYTLDETADNSTIDAGTFNVTLNRTFVAGWNTVCLPFAISDITGFFGAGAYAYDFTGYRDTEGLAFSRVDGTPLAAAKACLVYVPTAISDPISLTNVEIAAGSTTAGTTTNGKVSFVGTYSSIGANSTLVGKYVVGNSEKGSKIFKATTSTTMKGFRAYFNAAAGARLSIVLNDDTQGIQTIMAAEDIAPEGAYSLSGQKVETLKKGGLYIINGKKQVMK